MPLVLTHRKSREHEEVASSGVRDGGVPYPHQGLRPFAMMGAVSAWAGLSFRITPDLKARPLRFARNPGQGLWVTLGAYILARRGSGLQIDVVDS